MKNPNAWRRAEWRWLWMWIGAVIAGVALTWAVVRHTTHTHLQRDAEATALSYVDTLRAAVPGLPRLMQTRTLDADTADSLRAMRQLGDVFRFKIFDREARLLLVSEDLDKPMTAFSQGTLGDDHGSRSKEVEALVLSGQNHIELKDGTGKANRPPLYSEAYVPARQGTELIGVIEVYVDQTARRERINASAARIGAVVMVVLLGLGAAGTWHWLQRWRAQRKVEERVRYLARHDVLSGALNRASFHDALEQATWHHQAAGTRFAVLCIDLDRFKEVNDMLGHAAGDEVLRQARCACAACCATATTWHAWVATNSRCCKAPSPTPTTCARWRSAWCRPWPNRMKWPANA